VFENHKLFKAAEEIIVNKNGKKRGLVKDRKYIYDTTR
jgi:hypothetical protein